MSTDGGTSVVARILKTSFFRPGLTVTCVQEIKGLEFDYVVIPDAAASTYPDTPESRRALYVAVTRATHRLGLGSAGAWSPLLTSAQVA